MLGSVVECVRVLLRQGLGECGALTPWQVKHDTLTVPPLKSLPWQSWHRTKPLEPVAGALAEVPWESGEFQPAGCPEGPPGWQAMPAKLAEKQLTLAMPPSRSFP